MKTKQIDLNKVAANAEFYTPTLRKSDKYIEIADTYLPVYNIAETIEDTTGLAEFNPQSTQLGAMAATMIDKPVSNTKGQSPSNLNKETSQYNKFLEVRINNTDYFIPATDADNKILRYITSIGDVFNLKWDDKVNGILGKLSTLKLSNGKFVNYKSKAGIRLDYGARFEQLVLYSISDDVLSKVNTLSNPVSLRGKEIYPAGYQPQPSRDNYVGYPKDLEKLFSVTLNGKQYISASSNRLLSYIFDKLDNITTNENKTVINDTPIVQITRESVRTQLPTNKVISDSGNIIYIDNDKDYQQPDLPDIIYAGDSTKYKHLETQNQIPVFIDRPKLSEYAIIEVDDPPTDYKSMTINVAGEDRYRYVQYVGHYSKKTTWRLLHYKIPTSTIFTTNNPTGTNYGINPSKLEELKALSELDIILVGYNLRDSSTFSASNLETVSRIRVNTDQFTYAVFLHNNIVVGQSLVCLSENVSPSNQYTIEKLRNIFPTDNS